MADELKPPVAIRITRPYASDAEFLEHEFDTLTHTSVVLLGAQPRPQGVVLRFEIVLATGESVLRGEGRVVGYKEKAHGGEPGLSLRFTRLDARSKSVVDRASALRDARSRGAIAQPLRPPEAPPPLPEPAAAVARPATRRPPPLPEWAKQAPIAPPSVGVAIAPPSVGVGGSLDVETTHVDPNFDLHPRDLAPLAAPEPPAERRESPGHGGLGEHGSPSPSEPPPEAVEPAAPPPPRVPIRPTPARPPPLPRTVAPLANLNARTSSPPPAIAPPPAFESETPSVATGAPSRIPTAVARPKAVGALAEAPRRGAPIAPPPNRDALLAKLRGRAQSLPDARVREILAKSP